MPRAPARRAGRGSWHGVAAVVLVLLAPLLAGAATAAAWYGGGRALRPATPLARMALRGGSSADAAKTEEQEHLAAGLSQLASARDRADIPDVPMSAAEPTAEAQLREHLSAVEKSPGDYIARPEHGSLRFCLCDAATLACKPRGISSAAIELHVTRRRNAWQRFYPLDLAALLADVTDTEEVFDEEGEMGQARTLAATGASPSGALTSTVSPWAWATQKVKFSDGSEGSARLLFAQESSGVIMWSLQRGTEEPMVERVCISEELGATPEGTKVSITWTTGANLPAPTPAPAAPFPLSLAVFSSAR